MLDLTHPFDATTVYWPTGEGFELTVLAHGPTPEGYGIDTASIDPGRSTRFEAHRVLAELNVPIVENAASLEELRFVHRRIPSISALACRFMRSLIESFGDWLSNKTLCISWTIGISAPKDFVWLIRGILEGLPEGASTKEVVR